MISKAASKTLAWAFAAALVIITLSVLMGPEEAFAKGKTVTFTPGGNSSVNYNKLSALYNKKSTGTIIIKKGSKFTLNGMIRAKSNKTIIAKGCTIYFEKGKTAMNNTPKSAGYNALRNVKIVGGKWRGKAKGGMPNPMFSLSNATNVTFDGVDIETNVETHSLELTCCKNVVIKNCKIKAVGKLGKDREQEQIQLDIATKRSMPRLAKLGKKYVAGQMCKNVVIKNCDVTGPVAVRANWTVSYPKSFHENLTIKNCRITSTGSEALAVKHAAGVKVIGNDIRCKVGNATAVYLNAVGKAPGMKKPGPFVFRDNKVWTKGHEGVRFGYEIAYNKVSSFVVTGNTVYNKKGIQEYWADPEGYKYSKISKKKPVVKNNKFRKK